MSKIINFFGWFLVIYAVAFVGTFMLFEGCIQDGHSSAECSDNTLSHMVIAPINLFK